MTNLLDDILTSEHVKPEAKAEMARAQLIVCDNVAQFFFEGTGQEVWDVTKDFPNIAPPFERMFLEYRTPKTIVSDKFGVQQFKGPSAVGVYFHAEKNADMPEALAAAMSDKAHVARLEEDSAKQWDTLEPVINEYAAKTNGSIPAAFASMPKALQNQLHAWELKRRVIRDAKEGKLSVDSKATVADGWFIEAIMYWRAEGRVIGPVFAWNLGVTREGQIARQGDMLAYASGAIRKDAAEASYEEQMAMNQGFGNFINPLFLAISFMHCKNVKMVEHDPSLSVHRHKVKRHPIPRMKYRTLEIAPMKEVLRKEGDSEKSGLQKALHICRGHFKDYREHGLFGKVKGMFWWESHVRGSDKEGLILKDYKVNEPHDRPQRPQDNV